MFLTTIIRKTFSELHKNKKLSPHQIFKNELKYLQMFLLISNDVSSLTEQKIKNGSLKQTSTKILVIHLVF